MGELVGRRGDYGFDAPYAPVSIAVWVALLVIAVLTWVVGLPIVAAMCLACAVSMLASTASYL